MPFSSAHGNHRTWHLLLSSLQQAAASLWRPRLQRTDHGHGAGGDAVKRWIPKVALEFLWYDADRALRLSGLLWVDHFWCRRRDLDGVYAAVLRRLGYKSIKWAVADKPGGNAKDDVYLTMLLQKPF